MSELCLFNSRWDVNEEGVVKGRKKELDQESVKAQALVGVK